MPKDKKSPTELGRNALDALMLLYYHAHGEAHRARIKEFDREMSDWRTMDMARVPAHIQGSINHARAWDRAIKVLIDAGRIE